MEFWFCGAQDTKKAFIFGVRGLLRPFLLCSEADCWLFFCVPGDRASSPSVFFAAVTLVKGGP
jgi:hypothetical protein